MRTAKAETAVATKGVVGKMSGDAKILQDARDGFLAMQKSWYLFAKSMHHISTGECYKSAGHESFKDYIEKEFPTLNYDTVLKYVNVVESWGVTIEARIKREPNYLPPTCESCYTLITVEKRKEIPKEEYSRIKKLLLDNQLSYLKLRSALKDYLKFKGGSVAKAIVDTEEIESELVRDIEKDEVDLAEMDFIESDAEDDMFDDAESEDDDVDGDEDDTSKADAVALLMNRVDYLIDNLPSHKSELTEINDTVVHFATRLEQLVLLSEEYLDRVEQLSKGEK